MGDGTSCEPNPCDCNGNGVPDECEEGAPPCVGPGNTRVFMVRAGGEASAPTLGPTTINMITGGTVTIEVWVSDTEGALLGNYQVATVASGAPGVGTTGTLDYIDNPDPDGCDSLLVDTTDANWVFSSQQPNPFCSETGLPDGIAMVANLGVGAGVAVPGLAYLGEFQFAASADADGVFTIDFIEAGLPPNGGSFLIDETGVGEIPATYQPLEIHVSEVLPCVTADDCGDVAPFDGATDDVCVWWECVAGSCVGTPKAIPSNMGGLFGECGLDDFCNLADALHALTCFANTNPCAAINIDAGGNFGDCAPDGFCNLADALHALTCSAGSNTCSCGPAPSQAHQPNVVGSASLRAVAGSRSVNAGDEVQIRVFVEGALPNLSAYQLDTAVSGGRQGSLDLVDITVETRTDFVFADADNGFDAFNVEKGQMLSGLMGGDVATGRRGYLATFTYRASTDAVGTFVFDVLHDEVNRDQTFIVGAEQKDKIEVERTVPTAIAVTKGKAHSIR